MLGNDGKEMMEMMERALSIIWPGIPLKQHLTKLHYPLFLNVGQSRVLNL